MNFVHRTLDLDAKKAYFEYVKQAKGLVVDLPRRRATRLLQRTLTPCNLMSLGSIKVLAEHSMSAQKLRRKRSATLLGRKENASRRSIPFAARPLLRSSRILNPRLVPVFSGRTLQVKKGLSSPLRAGRKEDWDSSLSRLISHCEQTLTPVRPRYLSSIRN